MFNFTTYFETMAANLVLIGNGTSNGHFFVTDSINNMEGLLMATRTMKFPCIIAIDNDESRYVERLADNVQETKFYTFGVFKKAKNLSPDDKKQVKYDLDIVIKKIVAKMKRDKGRAINGLRDLDMNSFSFFEIPAIGDNIIGKMCTFTVLTSAELNIQPQDIIQDFIL